MTDEAAMKLAEAIERLAKAVENSPSQVFYLPYSNPAPWWNPPITWTANGIDVGFAKTSWSDIGH